MADRERSDLPNVATAAAAGLAAGIARRMVRARLDRPQEAFR